MLYLLHDLGNYVRMTLLDTAPARLHLVPQPEIVERHVAELIDGLADETDLAADFIHPLSLRLRADARAMPAFLTRAVLMLSGPRSAAEPASGYCGGAELAAMLAGDDQIARAAVIDELLRHSPPFGHGQAARIALVRLYQRFPHLTVIGAPARPDPVTLPVRLRRG